MKLARLFLDVLSFVTIFETRLLTLAYRLKGGIDIPARVVPTAARLPQRRTRLGSASHWDARNTPKELTSNPLAFSRLTTAFAPAAIPHGGDASLPNTSG